MLTLIYFILILGVIVLVHEFGHFIFSKIFGVYVYEFSIGMGPKIWGTKEKKGKTTYNIRALPIGGFVQLAGEDPTEEDPEVPKGAFLYNKPVWQRFIIMGAGVFNNFVLGFIMLLCIGLFHGAVDLSPVVTKLDENLPMYQAGIREGDKVLKMNNESVSTRDDMRLFMAVVEPGTDITFVVSRDGKEQSFTVKPVEVEDEETKEKSFKYGISFENKIEHGVGAAFKFAGTQFGSYFKQIILTFKYLFTGKVGMKDMSGPVGIYSVVGEATQTDALLNIVNLIALLSVNVGFLNIMPFPAFDGGRILFLLIEKIKGSPVNPKIENAVNAGGFIFLMILMAVITVSDILKLF